MKLSLIASSLVLLLSQGGSTEAAAWMDQTVTCDPATPDICRGSLQAYSPSPAMIEHEDGTAETIYIGGWQWSYTFVRGLPNGHNDPESEFTSSYGIYDYGPNVVISLDDDQVSCNIAVGNETCNSCEVCSENANMDNPSFSADCTNLKASLSGSISDTGAGKMMECVPALPFFYPLEIPDNLTDLPQPLTSLTVCFGC